MDDRWFAQHFVVDSSRIRCELGYLESVNEDDGLRQTIEWELKSPPSDPDRGFDYPAEDSVIRLVSG